MTYAVREVFDTLQGEGARAGTRAVFVRLAGCNLWDGQPKHRTEGAGACAAWCDTDFAKARWSLAAPALVEAMDTFWLPNADQERWCVLTGGEPMLQVDAELIDELHSAGWLVAVETNGTVAVLPRGLDWVCVSPKRGSRPLLVDRADEVKVVLPGAGNGHEGWTHEQLEHLRTQIRADHYFVQPQDVIDPTRVEATYLHAAHARTSTQFAGLGATSALYNIHVQQCVAFVRQHPPWRLGLQAHKIVGLL